MKAIEYLKQIKSMDAKINADIEELAMLEALATKTTAVMGGERVQTSGSQQKMADYVVKITDLKERISFETARFTECRNKAKDIIFAACDSDCITLLCNRYLLYNTWEQIAEKMGFTYKWVSGGLHQRALSQLQKVLDEEGY